jgi:hypothetical protein
MRDTGYAAINQTFRARCSPIGQKKPSPKIGGGFSFVNRLADAFMSVSKDRNKRDCKDGYQAMMT